MLVRKALNRRRVKDSAETPAAQLLHVNATTTHVSQLSRQGSLAISPGERNFETSTLSAVAGKLTNSPFVTTDMENLSHRGSTVVPEFSDASPKLEDDGRTVINVSPLPDAEQMRQQALAQMLAEDPAPMWRPRARTRSRSRRRRAVDGGAEMNGNGVQRNASPTPTTISTDADTEYSISASTLPPAYDRYD
ncbi:uncharacterized protein PHACADRAFT_172996 [Phanerochaete carnosa HHB-10118-sp]|uniref:Uncharacterized protein n=1 Tax=Phanerochaete carnosa (strain HHB-10118-sp) TaxID=650164 RepID=K5WDN2_PHACS|nr:uncharacterized protein PHACADRAFT_172996 [Phanerochaete carnosa HHB-10118-sp]EKM57365.1 hypothetical protein PHACADRAFT_172996 [Phanerochaete carnosa HHB-10118-sp]